MSWHGQWWPWPWDRVDTEFVWKVKPPASTDGSAVEDEEGQSGAGGRDRGTPATFPAGCRAGAGLGQGKGASPGPGLRVYTRRSIAKDTQLVPVVP